MKRKTLLIVLSVVLAFSCGVPMTAFAHGNTGEAVMSEEMNQNAGNDELTIDDFDSDLDGEGDFEEEDSDNLNDLNDELDEDVSDPPIGEEPDVDGKPIPKPVVKPSGQIQSYKGKNAKRIPILTYHRLASAKEKKKRAIRDSSLFLSVNTFKKQMSWLHRNGYRTISTEEFYLWYKGKIKLPKKSVLITFDDGSYSVVKYGLPILRQYNMKATIFMIGKGTRKKTNKMPLSYGSYHRIGRDVMKEVQRTYPNLEFQSHTYNMHRKIKGTPAMMKLSSKKQFNDIEKMYNKYGFTFLAYPYGKRNAASRSAVKASHVKMAFDYGTNTYATRSQSRYAIKRIKISATQPMSKFYRWFK